MNQWKNYSRRNWLTLNHFHFDFKSKSSKLFLQSEVEKWYYTVIKSEDFLIDWRDECENVLLCSPCSGHGFKFGPIIGKIIADLLVRDESIPLFEKNRYLSRWHYHLGVNLKWLLHRIIDQIYYSYWAWGFIVVKLIIPVFVSQQRCNWI